MLATLGPVGISTFVHLKDDAVATVSHKLHAMQAHGADFADAATRHSSAADVGYVLEMLRGVLEFGTLPPFVQYLRWLHNAPTNRSATAMHIEESLQYLAHYFKANMPPAEGQVVDAALQQALAAYTDPAPTDTVAPAAPAEWPQTPLFREALLRGDSRAAVRILDEALDSGQSLVDFEFHVIQPAMYAIGELWHRNQVSVAQEHLATAIVHTAMTAGLLRSPQSTLNGKKVMLACVEGNQHALGLRMVADQFMLSGWEVQYLGANVPAHALLDQVEKWQPDLVGLSVSFASQMPTARATMDFLRQNLGEHSPALMIGGLAINSCAPLARESGADGYSTDAPTALTGAESLLQARAQVHH